MRKYRVEIIETLCKSIEVEATSEDDPRIQAVIDSYYNGEINLTYEDYIDTEFKVERC